MESRDGGEYDIDRAITEGSSFSHEWLSSMPHSAHERLRQGREARSKELRAHLTRLEEEAGISPFAAMDPEHRRTAYFSIPDRATRLRLIESRLDYERYRFRVDGALRYEAFARLGRDIEALEPALPFLPLLAFAALAGLALFVLGKNASEYVAWAGLAWAVIDRSVKSQQTKLFTRRSAQLVADAVHNYDAHGAFRYTFSQDEARSGERSITGTAEEKIW